MTDHEYDPFDLRRPRRAKRISAITGKPTKVTEETELQIQCFTYYEKRILIDAPLRHSSKLFAVAPNDNKIPMAQRVLAKRMGKKKGPHDAQFLDKRKAFRYVWIEFKAPDGHYTPEQRDFAEWLSDTPIRTVEVRSLNEFIQVIDGTPI